MALTVWGHAVAALLFAGAAGTAWRGGRVRLFTAALVATALWALAVAGIEGRDPAAQVAETARDLLWLGLVVAAMRQADVRSWSLPAAGGAVAAVMTVAGVLALAEAAAHGPAAAAPLGTARLLFRMLGALGALVLVRQLHAVSASGGRRLTAAALAAMWGADLLLAATGYARPDMTPAVLAARGAVMAGVAVTLGAAAQRRGRRAPALSRPAAVRTLAALALALYVAGAAALARLAEALGGDHGRALEVGVVVGAATALVTVLSSSQLGPWLRVTLAKHLFRHRYDYRAEWLRFAETLRAGPAPLGERVAQAVAQPLDAPAALLLDADGDAAAWRWTGEAAALPPDVAAYLAATGRVIELDAVRAGAAPDDAAAVPVALLAHPDAWVLAPLPHGEALAGAVLLARPPHPRPLDWEDLDLLRTLGRQAASHLAEDRAGRALAEAQRFDEFNRRFAFILHDIKNLVSQQQLVARNAERHADNPAFRADMVATLRESADRMTQLLARLAERAAPPVEPLGPVDCAALARRLGARAGAAVDAVAPAWASAHPQRLEQALGHLLQNAGEASPAAVTLAVRAAGDRIAIEVADRGRGMTAAFVRDELFRPFSSTKPAGFGIGAHEARMLVLGMGGTLAVDSREGEGTRFRIELPAAPALAAAA